MDEESSTQQGHAKVLWGTSSLYGIKYCTGAETSEGRTNYSVTFAPFLGWQTSIERKPIPSRPMQHLGICGRQAPRC